MIAFFEHSKQRRILSVIALCLFVLATPIEPVSAAQSYIDYSGWRAFLKQSVFNVGLPDRVALSRPRPAAGTKIYRGSKTKTRAEANRVFYHSISATGFAHLSEMRRSMGALAHTAGFDQLSDNERLAFWLNYRNMAVVEMVATGYPFKNARRYMAERLDQKWLKVGDSQWSIRDMENHIVETWKNPLVIYGFHRGYIGSPNIRYKPYTGGTVWRDLRKNAKEFTSSLRGLQFRGRKAYVSEFYKDFKALFPSFEQDLRGHMAHLAYPSLRTRIQSSKGFSARISDPYIADLYGGVVGTFTTANTNAAALLDAVHPAMLSFFVDKTMRSRPGTPLPEHVVELMKTVQVRWQEQMLPGRVIVEDYVGSGKVPEIRMPEATKAKPPNLL